MGKMTYIPDSLMADVEQLKEMQKRGLRYEIKCYDMICYDSKEERETEERLSPCTPFYKEEKEKEERGERGERGTLREGEGVGGNFNPVPAYLNPPSFEEVEVFFEAGDFKMLTAKEFYERCAQKKWLLPKGPIMDWRASALGMEAYRRTHNWKPASTPAPKLCDETLTEKKHRLLLAVETRLQEQAEQQTAERNERLKEQAEKAVSYQEYRRVSGGKDRQR